MLLAYLVTSRTRRGLLRLLWAREAAGSVSELAREAGVSFASAHGELEAMRREGLARAERVGASVVYRADRRYRQSRLVRQLLGESAPRSPSGPDERVRAWLAAAGAPLLVSRRAKAPAPPLEELLAQALALSHHDAAVARVLPVVIWKHRDRLDPERLLRAATARDEGPALGFFLELTALLGADPRLASLATRLRDRRRIQARPYFARARGRLTRALARRRTPALARRWGYLMNMDLDSFAAPFEKHASAPS